MKLVLIYGPPAVGKLTVANELAVQTGLKLFHYHMTIDFITKVFEFGSPAFIKLLRKVCLEIIKEAAKNNKNGLIFTFVYGRFPHDGLFIHRLVRAVERHRGEVCFVRLYCEGAVLEQRVVSPLRKAYAKITTVELLREVLKGCNLLSVLPGRDSLNIDNSYLNPSEVVRKIIAHYGLLT